MRDYSRELRDLSCRIWDYAELKFDEKRSAGALASFLEAEGFLVTRGIAGMETAFSASWGEGGPALKGMMYAAKVLAEAGKQLADDPSLLKKAREEFLEETGGRKYVCPIPAHIRPHKNIRELEAL